MSEPAGTSGDPPASGGDLFIVDDSPARALLATILKDAGHRVRTARTAEEGVVAITMAPPELILIDGAVPVGGGLEVCRALKRAAATRDTPIIYLSSGAESVAAFRAGAVDHVTRPFAAEEVLARVETQLKLSRLRRELEARNRELARTNAQLVAARSHAEQIFDALADALAGTIIDGRFHLEGRIGAGATATVYRARVVKDGSAAAVKVLRPHGPTRAGHGGADTTAEHRSTARVAHPNAVTVLDAGVTPAGLSWLAMELLEGLTLADELAEAGRLSCARCAAIVLPVARVLAAAHAAGVIHRDVKPANVFLHRGATGQIVKVLDFGIARLQDDPDDADHSRGERFAGTPLYMAPERLLGQPSDARADVYSLGAVTWQALTGRPPFEAASLGALVWSCLNDTPLPLAEVRPDIHPELARLVTRMLSKHAADRPHMDEVATALHFAFAAQAAAEASRPMTMADETISSPIAMPRT